MSNKSSAKYFSVVKGRRCSTRDSRSAVFESCCLLPVNTCKEQSSHIRFHCVVVPGFFAEIGDATVEEPEDSAFVCSEGVVGVRREKATCKVGLEPKYHVSLLRADELLECNILNT